MRRLTHLIVLAAFVFSCGGKWYVLQGVAWFKMIHDYSRVVPLAEAVSMTLSGKYPCEICKAIADKKNSEQQKALAFDKYEKKFTPPLAIELTRRSSVTILSYADYPSSLDARAETPPTPPPRSALG